MRECQGFKDVEIFPVDHGMKRLAVATLDLARADKAGVDIVLELRDHDQVGNRNALPFNVNAIEQFQLGHTAIGGRFKPRHLPKALVSLGRRSTRGKNMHLVALADGPTGKFYAFGPMALKVEAE